MIPAARRNYSLLLRGPRPHLPIDSQGVCGGKRCAECDEMSVCPIFRAVRERGKNEEAVDG
jgi:hypothetical protein